MPPIKRPGFLKGKTPKAFLKKRIKETKLPEDKLAIDYKPEPSYKRKKK